jgi:hypothetical protein
MNANLQKMMAKMDAWLGETKASPETMEACEGKMEAFLEKKELTPEETEAMAEFQEIPNGVTDEEMIGTAKDRSRGLPLAIGCHRQLKTRTKRDGGSRQECAATVGWPTRRTVPAMRKGKLRRGPGKECSNGIRGQSKASRNEKRRRMCPVFKNGVWDREERQHLLLNKERILNKMIRQSPDLETVKWIFGSPNGLREPCDRILWKCQPLPKWKR